MKFEYKLDYDFVNKKTIIPSHKIRGVVTI